MNERKITLHSSILYNIVRENVISTFNNLNEIPKYSNERELELNKIFLIWEHAPQLIHRIEEEKDYLI